MERKVRALIKKPGEAACIRHVEDKLEAWQEIVGGNIETVTLFEDMAVICNEEGRLLKLPFNCDILGCDFVGPIVIVGVEGDEFADVPEEEKMRKWFPTLFKVAR